MKIRVTIGETSIDFHPEGSNETSRIMYSDHPDVFDHPRHFIADPDKAAKIINPVMKKFSRLLSLPKINYKIEKKMNGKITDVDLRTINEAFIWAGARKSKYEV